MPSSTQLLVILCLSLAAVINVAGKTTKVKTLILGAGAAGVTAARTLYKGGQKDFLVLEAQDYIGGRIKQHDYNGYPVEEGANWVHGIEGGLDNPMWQIKQKYGLKGFESNYDDFVVRNASGYDITDMAVKTAYEKVMKKLDRLLVIKDESIDISIKEASRRVGWQPKTQMEKAIERYKVDFEYTGNTERTSFNGWGYYDRDFFVADPRGYGVFLKLMSVPFKDKILLNKKVAHIRRLSGGVVVTLASGDVYQAQFVLSTFSNGVLGSGAVKFSPPFPNFKKKSLKKVPMGHYTKVFVKFPRKFWDDNEYIVYATDRDDGYFHTWQDLKRPGIFPDSSGMLLMTCTGNTSIRVEQTPKSQLKQEIYGILQKVYGNRIPYPNDVFLSTWSKNKFIRGAYPNPIVGAKREDYANIGSNLGRLFFAGDGTTSETFGFVHGAMETGSKKAYEILNCIWQSGYPACPVYTINKKTINNRSYMK